MASKPLPSRLVPASVMRMMVPRTVKSKSAAGEAKPGEPGGASTIADLEVVVDMATKALLGIDVDWGDGKTLYIKNVQPGAIDDWNKEHPDQPVRPGDRILAVNGFEGDTEAMIRECRARRELRMTVRPCVPVLKPTAAKPQTSAGAKPGGPAEAQRDPWRPHIVDLDGFEEPMVKRPRTGGDSLYSGMPAPDPEKDKSHETRAKELDIFAEAPALENPRLVAFLDIDGVLKRLEGGIPTINLDGEVLPVSIGGRAFAPEAVRALRFLVHRTGCGIVLSSEWRRDAKLREEVATTLRALGLPPLRGQTALLQAREELLVGTVASPDREATMRLRWAERRSREITLWLREHPEVRHWVALDDLDLSIADDVKVRTEAMRMGPSLILCDPGIGLTLSRSRAAAEKLLRRATGPPGIDLTA